MILQVKTQELRVSLEVQQMLFQTYSSFKLMRKTFFQTQSSFSVRLSFFTALHCKSSSAAPIICHLVTLSHTKPAKLGFILCTLVNSSCKITGYRLICLVFAAQSVLIVAKKHLCPVLHPTFKLCQVYLYYSTIRNLQIKDYSFVSFFLNDSVDWFIQIQARKIY